MSPERCTGIAARWCPVCGDCTCKAPHPDIRDYSHNPVDRIEELYLEDLYAWEADPHADAPLYGLNDRDCPLHNRDSPHATGGDQ